MLETVNATRAFLTIDSGFPLAELEQSLRTNRPFVYDYKPTQAPVLYGPEYWVPTKERANAEFIDNFLGDPSICRLYLGLSKLDPTTADELRKSTTVQKIRAYAHVLDFYGLGRMVEDAIRGPDPCGGRRIRVHHDFHQRRCGRAGGLLEACDRLPEGGTPSFPVGGSKLPVLHPFQQRVG